MAGSRATAAAPTYFEALSASLNRRWAPLDGIVVDSMKYIELPIPELYDLKTDPHELNNLVASEPARVEELRSRLQQLRGPRADIKPDIDSAETRERLRSLGYASGSPSGARARYTEADDPKRLIGFDARLQEIVGQYLAGDLDGALARCRRLAPRAARHAADALPSRAPREGEREPRRARSTPCARRWRSCPTTPRRSPCLAHISPRLGVPPKRSNCSSRSRGARRPTPNPDLSRARAREGAAVRRSPCDAVESQPRGPVQRTAPPRGGDDPSHGRTSRSCATSLECRARSESEPGARAHLARPPQHRRPRPAEASSTGRRRALSIHASTRRSWGLGCRSRTGAKRSRHAPRSSSSWITRRRRGSAPKSIGPAPFSQPCGSRRLSFRSA